MIEFIKKNGKEMFAYTTACVVDTKLKRNELVISRNIANRFNYTDYDIGMPVKICRKVLPHRETFLDIIKNLFIKKKHKYIIVDKVIVSGIDENMTKISPAIAGDLGKDMDGDVIRFIGWK